MRRRPSIYWWVTSLFLISLFPLPSHAADPQRIPWVLDETYTGRYDKTFQEMRYDIPVILRQTLIDLSGRIGLRYQEGWRYPLVVGFTDDAPMGVENVLAYVQMFLSDEGRIKQDLKINLRAYQTEKFNFEKVLAHELVHAMLNDSLGAEASTKLPLWFHEGLAVYGADQGEQMLKSYVYQTGATDDSIITNGLENHTSALDYAEDYLAFKYIYKKHGISGLHNFIAEVAKRQGDIEAAYEYTCSESWENFQKKFVEFSKEEIKNIGVFKGRPGDMPQPY